METEAEERSFPLTKLTSEVVAVAKARESASIKVISTSTKNKKKRQSKFSKILKEIVRALGLANRRSTDSEKDE